MLFAFALNPAILLFQNNFHGFCQLRCPKRIFFTGIMQAIRSQQAGIVCRRPGPGCDVNITYTIFAGTIVC